MKYNFKKTTLAPYTYLTPSLNTIALTMIFLLVPQIIMLFMTHSYKSLVLILIGVFASTMVELLHNLLRKKNLFQNPIFILQGLLIGFFIPENYPPIATFFIIFFSLVFVKYIFGGTFNSWINPVVFTIILLYLLGTSFFPSYLVTPADIESGNPALILFQNGRIPVLDFDDKITNWINSKIFSKVGIEIPHGYISLIWDNGSEIPAFRFNLLTLFASLFLISFSMIKAIIPYVFLFTYGLLVWLFGFVFYGGTFAQGDIFLALMTSGTIFAAFYLLDWFGTSPMTIIGKICYGFFAGIVGFFICGIGTSPIGTMFMILCINICSPIIQLCENFVFSIKQKKLQKVKG